MLEQLWQAIIAKKGVTHQMAKASEELDELRLEVRNWLRNNGSRRHTVEEMADVLNMIGQIKIMLNITDEEIDKIQLEKMRRAMGDGAESNNNEKML